MHVFTFLASPVAQQQWDDITPFSPTFNVQGSNNIRKVKVATQQNINSTLCNFVPDEREDGKNSLIFGLKGLIFKYFGFVGKLLING